MALRTSSLWGKFTVNLGVYIPEIDLFRGHTVPEWVQEHDCSIQMRLGPACGLREDRWWVAQPKEEIIAEVRDQLASGGITFLDRFETRELVLAECESWPRLHTMGSKFPWQVGAIILVSSGRKDAARAFLDRFSLRAERDGVARFREELRLDADEEEAT